ncbi:MAG: hypothetical protein ACFFBP_13330 [Promethearchaeota archaeon]
MPTEIIKINCPECSKKGTVEIDALRIAQSSKGIIAINIENNTICNHSFVVYIDKNAMVRDCFIADFEIKLPEIDLDHKVDESIVPNKELLDVSLITLNFKPDFLAKVVQSCLLNQKILIINDLEFLNKHISNFYEYIFNTNFKINISILNRTEYRKHKKKYSEHLVIDSYRVIQDKLRKSKTKSMKIENKIVQKFIEEPDQKSSLILIKNEITKAFEISLKMIEWLKSFKDPEKIGKKALISKLEEFYKKKFSFSYLDFILNILDKYFKEDLTKISDYYYPGFGV